MKLIDWSYAVTVHKSQGSEYKNVIMTLMKKHGRLVTRNIFYTAITRAKSCLVFVGEKEAITDAVNNKDDSRRNTMLSLFCSYYYKKEVLLNSL